jgi:2OG-Fe(II) oxygenase superfamily
MEAEYSLPPLREVLDNQRWVQHLEPFPYITANDVFHADFYQELVADYVRFLPTHLGGAEAHGPSLHKMTGYDAHAMDFPADFKGPLSILFSAPWLRLIADVTNVRATVYVSGGFHHHVVGSENGSVHNDLNPGWFVQAEESCSIQLSRPELCNYKTGITSSPELKTHEAVRGVAVLFYLSNPPWNPGDGGETGLYTGQDQCVDQPTRRVAPVNNSLLIFECTPFSYHSFISNKRSSRNTIILWLHREKLEVAELWGESAILGWT